MLYKNSSIKGFTLIELLVVVLIIGILSSIALPQYRIAVEKAKYTKYIPWVNALADAQEIYYLANGNYATQLDELGVLVPPEARNCPREYRQNLYDRRVCRPNATQLTMWGMSDGPSNAQAGDENVRYLKFFQHVSCPSLIPNCRGKRYCFSKTDIGAKVCMNLHGRLTSSDATWKRFELP
ncbi:MAG: prepilin-type N-terminal cleavage/methylation domain-containing protein [Elusimicrobiaceae bacterium]|nr:prepilin-type N-terminal cleavage/methylation domain-containing protein [Elusimicrobiaceae bacterium]